MGAAGVAAHAIEGRGATDDDGAFEIRSRTLAALFGVQASLLLYGAERASRLETALGTRDSIGQAKGS